jgi:hypothetical protein
MSLPQGLVFGHPYVSVWNTPTKNFTRSATVLATSTSVINLAAPVSVVIDVTGITDTYQLRIVNTSGAFGAKVSAKNGVLIGGQATQQIVPGQILVISWNATNNTFDILVDAARSRGADKVFGGVAPNNNETLLNDWPTLDINKSGVYDLTNVTALNVITGCSVTLKTPPPVTRILLVANTSLQFVTLQTVGGILINGGSSYLMKPGTIMQFKFDGANWLLFPNIQAAG